MFSTAMVLIVHERYAIKLTYSQHSLLRRHGTNAIHAFSVTAVIVTQSYGEVATLILEKSSLEKRSKVTATIFWL